MCFEFFIYNTYQLFKCLLAQSLYLKVKYQHDLLLEHALRNDAACAWGYQTGVGMGGEMVIQQVCWLLCRRCWWCWVSNWWMRESSDKWQSGWLNWSGIWGKQTKRTNYPMKMVHGRVRTRRMRGHWMWCRDKSKCTPCLPLTTWVVASWWNLIVLLKICGPCCKVFWVRCDLPQAYLNHLGLTD